MGDYFGLLTQKLEKFMKLVSISAYLNVSYFAGINFREIKNLSKICATLYPKNNIYFIVREVKYPQIAFF